MKTDSPNVKELSDETVACVSFIGNYCGKPEIFADLFGKLCGWAGPRGLINKDSKFLAAYYDDPKTTPLDELRLDICMSVPEAIAVEGEIQKKVLPGGQYAVMHVELSGPEEYGPAWEAIVEWARKNDYTIDTSRPCYEHYLNNPEEHPEKHHLLDVCMSIKEESVQVP